MIRIRAIKGGAALLSRDRVEQVQEIFRASFPDLAGYADAIPRMLRDPMEYGYKSALLVAEGALNRVDAFALVLHFPSVDCGFLDFIAVRPGLRGSGIGGALYEAAREFFQRLDAKGLYLEVQPDDPELTPEPKALDEARRRIRFYEQYGVRVIDGTDYSLPVGDPPSTALLLFDGLGRTDALPRREAQQAVEMILTKRFRNVSDPEYTRRVVESFRDDPVRFRPLLVRKPERVEPAVASHRLGAAFAMVVSPRHEIHHVKERGYFERPVRIKALTEALAPTGLFTVLPTREHGEKPVLAVHDADFVHYLRTVASKLKEGRPFYPDTFPMRRPEKRPKELPVQAGYYCIDDGTPLYRNAYVAAKASDDAALTAADEILAGRRLAYAVCRPPGHHAGRRFFGGFCYFNNAAIAAQYIVSQGKVAILDIDFHHGNGTQDIFYERDDVFTLSIHGNPDYAYPYFSGYDSETGEGAGAGFNRNFELAPQTDETKYLRTLERAIDQVEQYRPEVLIVGLGFDIMKGDPTGTLLLTSNTMRQIGRRLMELGLPTLVVQEGGYNVRNIRRGSVAFFTGCAEGIVG